MVYGERGSYCTMDYYIQFGLLEMQGKDIFPTN